VSERWPIPDAACLAVEAGCDAILICSDMDALFAAREALAKRASKDAAFAARLRDGAERGMALRRRHPPKAAADTESLDRALTTGASLEVADELRSRLSA
jgi:beta-N-acetylhexosaminidase